MTNELKDFINFDVENYPGVNSRSYVAKIVGEHPQYGYARKFLPLKHSMAGKKHHYSCDMEPYGIYEQSTKYYSLENGRCTGQNREYFAMFDSEYYDLYPDEVPFALFNLNLQLGIR